MINELKLAIVHFTRQNPMQICACAWTYRWTKTMENQDWATGPPGRRVVAGRGPVFSKTLQLLRFAAGRWAVVGLRTAGALGRWAVAGRGPRAAGPRACFEQNPTVTSICPIAQAVWNLFGFKSSLFDYRFVSAVGTSIIWRSIVVLSSSIIGGEFEGFLVKTATWKLIVYDVDVGSYERGRPNHGT